MFMGEVVWIFLKKWILEKKNKKGLKYLTVTLFFLFGQEYIYLASSEGMPFQGIHGGLPPYLDIYVLAKIQLTYLWSKLIKIYS